MSGFGRGRGTGQNRWVSDHERACQRAAERLSLPLPAAEAAWLDWHLARCSWCAAVADDYAVQRQRLRRLTEPPPPRDLWARTSAALDRAEQQAGRELPGPSVFPGRGGEPGSQGSRSIRGLRAERRASAFRATSRSAATRARLERSRGVSGYAWAAPFGALAAMAVVIVVGGTIMLTDSFAPVVPSNRPGNSPGGSGVAAATPLAVGDGQVAWLSAGDDGTYSLNFAQVSQVCPATARPDCAPIPSNGARHLPTIRVTPHTVLSSPTKSQLVVVDASAKGRGGSLYVVAIPAGSGAQTSGPTATAALDPLASPPVTTPPGAAASASPEVAVPTRSPTPALTAPVASATTAATASDAAAPATPAGASATVDASPTATEPPGPSSSEPGAASSTPTSSEPPDGPYASPGESAEPSGSDAATSPSPEPTASALAIISNVVVVGETAAYSPDGTMLAFSARPADGSHGPDIYLWRLGDAAAHAVTSDHASIFSGWLDDQLIGSRAVDANGRPASSAPAGSLDSGAQAPGPGGGPAAAGSSGVDGAPPGTESAEPSASPEPSAASAAPSSEAGAAGSNAEAAGSLSFAGSPGPTVPGAIPQSFMIDSATEIETSLVAPAWRPVVDPTGRFVAYWAGSLRYDATTLTWLPDRGVLVLALWSALAATDPTAVLAPMPLLSDGTDTAPGSDWDIRWDATGSHIGLWTADPDDPDVGRLSLLTIDSTTGRVDPSSVLLQGVPALAGFSIGADRMAWATPPGQDGEGSRVQVLAWIGENAGNIDSQPVSGTNAVVVVR